MIEFSSLVAEKWNIPEKIAAEICARFEEGDTIFYLSDYHIEISVEVDASVLGGIFDFLSELSALAGKKKRVLNALKKADALAETTQSRVKMTTSSSELDDMLLPHRPNPRSRGQMALKKGIGPLADTVQEQQVETGSLEELAEQYVGKDKTLKTVDDVIGAAKDVLVERFAYDETVRSMVRDFGYEDGFFEVQPNSKKDKEFAVYRNKMLQIPELSAEEYIKLFKAEDDKKIRFKHGVPLFRITELLRHHFLINPDSIGFDIICDAIDECWTRLLQPVVERDVKARVRREAENWAFSQITESLNRQVAERKEGIFLATSVIEGKELVVIALDGDGRLLGAARETKKTGDHNFASSRLRQFNTRYRPGAIIIVKNDHAAEAEQIVRRTLGLSDDDKCVVRQGAKAAASMANSEWMLEKCADLDEAMKQAYAVGLIFVEPFTMIVQIGVRYFDIHPLQDYVDQERLTALVSRVITGMDLHKGITNIAVPDSVLMHLSCMDEAVAAEIRKRAAKKELVSKESLRDVPKMTNVIYRNIAGYIIFPQSRDPLDRTLVHPDYFDYVRGLLEQLGKSAETLISDPDQIRAIGLENFTEKVYVEQHLIQQLRAGQSYLTISGQPKRRMRLGELEEGAIVQGKVTNITKFGVFVDINAACDGLVHISQLADSYVETPEQVVHVGDQVDVRIIGIDKKKKRVSLSMKDIGDKQPKVRPSQGQLTSLADHFKNR